MRPAAPAIVLPTIRESSLAEFLSRWEPEFRGLDVIVVEDNPEPTFDVPGWIRRYTWLDIDRTLGDDSWIIPRRSDCVRSFGYYLAYQAGAEWVLTMDDDCYPEASYQPSYLESLRAVMEGEQPGDRWWNTIEGLYPRGYPYSIRDAADGVGIHHGLWSNIPDLDALTQKQNPEFRTPVATRTERVPTGRYFPMCGMNLAFRREMIPALYFLLMGQDASGNHWPYDRFGDIWAGIFAKRIADHLGFAVTSGAPSVHHDRASNVEVNLAKETPGYPICESLWRDVDSVRLTGSTAASCYRQIADQLPSQGEYWDRLRQAMKIWAALFE